MAKRQMSGKLHASLKVQAEAVRSSFDGLAMVFPRRGFLLSVVLLLSGVGDVSLAQNYAPPPSAPPPAQNYAPAYVPSAPPPAPVAPPPPHYSQPAYETPTYYPRNSYPTDYYPENYYRGN